MPADVAGQVLGGGLAGRQAGHAEDGHGAANLHLLVAAGAFQAFADGAGGVPLDQEHPGRGGEPEIGRGIQDSDGALVAPAVPDVEGFVGDRGVRPVQGVDLVVEPACVPLHDHHVVRQQFGGDQLSVGADGVRGVHGEHAPADPACYPLGQTAQQRRELGHLVGFRADQPFGQHHRLLVGGRRQQVGHLPVLTDRAPHGLAVDRDRR